MSVESAETEERRHESDDEKRDSPTDHGILALFGSVQLWNPRAAGSVPVALDDQSLSVADFTALLASPTVPWALPLSS